MKISRLCLVALLSGSIALTAVAKDDKGQGHSKKAEKSAKKAGKDADSGEKATKGPHLDEKAAKGPDSHKQGKSAISQHEKDIFHDYVHTPNRNLPPGLAKKVARGKELPPGWQKKMAVGQICPPDIFQIAVPLPKDLIIKLPPPPVGTITVAVQGKVVRLHEKTKEIVDIIDLPEPKRR